MKAESRIGSDGIPEKRCTKCRKWFDATRKNFAPNKLGLYGLRPDCMACARVRSSQYTKTHPEIRRAYAEHVKNDPVLHERRNARARERARLNRSVTLEHIARTLLAEKGLKYCPLCHKVKPATHEFFPFCWETSNHFTSRCHECNRKNAREQYKRKKGAQS